MITRSDLIESAILKQCSLTMAVLNRYHLGDDLFKVELKILKIKSALEKQLFRYGKRKNELEGLIQSNSI